MMNLWHNARGWSPALLLFMASPAFAGTLIDTYGHFPVAGTPWTIDVSAYGLTVDLRMPNIEPKDSPPGWKPHPGWFVFVEDSNAWAYDGAGMVWVEVVTPKNVSVYTFKPHRDMADIWGVILPCRNHLVTLSWKR